MGRFRQSMPLLFAGVMALGWMALPPAAQMPFTATILAQTATRLDICPALDDWLNSRVKIESLQVAGEGFSVFYSADCSGKGITAPSAGFVVNQRNGVTWQTLGGEDVSYYDAGCMMPRIAGQKLCCLVSNGDEGLYTAIFGLVLASNVKSIEIAFDDGVVLHSVIVAHRFAISRAGVSHGSELRALASDGRVIDALPLDLSAGAQAAGFTGCRA